MEIITLLCIIFLHVSPSFSQNCSPCFCCKQGTGCSDAQLGIDNFCLGGCIDGFMSPQCQKRCVNQRCQICSNETTCDKCYAGYYGDQCCVSVSCETCLTRTTCDTCYAGYYGDQCQSSCPSVCTTCTSSTLCTSCRDGYYGDQCQSSNVCSNKCKDFLCDIYGHCLECIDPDFTGGNCDRCIDGKYGSQCKHNCPLNCLSCMSETNCSSCKEGLKGSICSWKSECPDNCYENTCLSTGKCESCKAEFFGEYCNMTCSQNCKYGTCFQNGICIEGCKEFFSGQACDQKICPLNCSCDTLNNCVGCKEHYFGRYCSLTCTSCKDTQCPVDKLADKCDACADGTFGNLCNEPCPEHCLNNRCNQDSGSCTCENEYMLVGGKCFPSICPANCSTCITLDYCDVCVNDYFYGDTCEHECTHCMTETTCRKSDKYCFEACADGLSGSYCDIPCNERCAACERSRSFECTSCKTGTYGSEGSYYKCNEICNSNCFNNACAVIDGACADGCVNGYKGNYCKALCATFCLNKTCDQRNGTCLYGCMEGYFGIECTYECRNEDSKCFACTSKQNEFELCTQCSKEFYPGPNGRCIPCEPNCAGGCSQLTGRCDECSDSYQGIYCDIPCPQDCMVCYQNNGTCKICENQTWGESCLRKCSSACQVDKTSISSCDIVTGECKLGCIAGRHGPYCERNCDQRCGASNDGVKVCRQKDGLCMAGCESGYSLEETGCLLVKDEFAGEISPVTVAIISGVNALLVIGLVIAVGFIVYLKRRQKLLQKEETKQINTTEHKPDEEGRDYEELQERTLNPNYHNVKDTNYDMLFANSSI